MDDRDYFFVLWCVAGLTVLSLLHSWIDRKELDLIIDLRTDVDWLKDNTVAIEARA
jgi:hypothetical protein